MTTIEAAVLLGDMKFIQLSLYGPHASKKYHIIMEGNDIVGLYDEELNLIEGRAMYDILVMSPMYKMEGTFGSYKVRI